MSYFKNMFRSPENSYQTWLLHVAQHDVITIYKLDSNGLPIDMVSGSAWDTILGPLKQVYPHCKLETINYPEYPWSWGFYTPGNTTWEKVRRTLVAKSGSDMRGKNRDVFERWADPLQDYFVGRYRDKTFDLTAKAKRIDVDLTNRQ